MATDPKYVRLVDKLSGGVLADVTGGTGWSISGMGVRAFPEDKDEARFVRNKVRAGLLEPASKAEFDEANPEGPEVEVKMVREVKVPHQEGQVVEEAREARKALKEHRAAQGRKNAADWDDDDDAFPDHGRPTSNTPLTEREQRDAERERRRAAKEEARGSKRQKEEPEAASASS